MVSALESLVPFLKFKAQGLTLQLPKVVSWIARSDNDVRGLKKNCSRVNNNMRMWLLLHVFCGQCTWASQKTVSFGCTRLSNIDFPPVFVPLSCHISHDMYKLVHSARLLYPNSCAAETQTRFVSERSHCNCSGKLLRCSKTIVVLPIPIEQHTSLHTSSCPAEKIIIINNTECVASKQCLCQKHWKDQIGVNSRFSLKDNVVM